MIRNFSNLKRQTFDLLVCGGGIYGAWTAYDAALRGLSVALIDQGDWAGGTSSASSKLVHGGLRYLESFDFKLVRKSLTERQMFLQTAAHRIWPLRFGLPLFKHGRIGRVKTFAGLTLYDWLARASGTDMAFRHYDKERFKRLFPFLDAKDLLGGFTYFDAQTDDARLVLELVDGALAHGAVCVNYCQVVDFTETDGRLTGASVQDRVSGESIQIKARQIVNTAGQWSSLLRHELTDYRLTKGVHLLLPPLPTDQALLLTAKSDGRVFFVIPWYGRTLVGTTDDHYDGDLDHVKVEPADRDYLLSEVNRVFTGHHWQADDIVGEYAGLRVLKQSDKTSPSAMSRDWELKEAANGLLSSIGGKLTSARADAEIIVDRVCERLGVKQVGTTFGRPFPWLPNEPFEVWQEQQSNRATELNIDPESGLWLLRRHGNRVDAVFELCRHHPKWTRRINDGVPLIVADLIYCAQNEMVVDRGDLLRRRMPLAILARIDPEALNRHFAEAGIKL